MHSQVEMVPKKVLIVGGSFAGLCTARHLDNYPSCDVSIVEPRDFFEYGKWFNISLLLDIVS